VVVPDAAPSFDIAIEEAAKMIEAAERRCSTWRRRDPLRRRPMAVTLAEQASLPTTMTLMALGAMPMDHPLSIGMLGMHGARYTNYVLEEADLLICRRPLRRPRHRQDRRVLPERQDHPHRHRPLRAAQGQERPRGHRRRRGQVLAELLPRVKPQLRKRWLSHVESLKGRFPLAMPGIDNPRSPYGLIHAVANCSTTAPSSPATSASTRCGWPRPTRSAVPASGSTPAVSAPWASASRRPSAPLAAPDRTVVCFSGDGSLKMNIQEMATAAQENVNVKIVLFNNQSLGLVHQQQNLFYGKRIMASATSARPTS
jgi:acetolactate synthase-1/2/3 large subunit